MGISREEAGRKGGKETVKRYGKEWMRELGRRGLRALANKYFAGSVAECMSYLRKKGAELQIILLADEAGQTCVEVPVILDPDTDPYFEEPSQEWQEQVEQSKPKGKKRGR